MPRGQTILNEEAARALAITAPKADISLRLPTLQESPRESTIAKRSSGDLAGKIDVSVASISHNRDMLSLFNLAGGQRTPRNAWVNLADLQQETAYWKPHGFRVRVFSSRG